jgi:energy-coupling factor transporter ATP-binding protein EcfA2
MIRNVEIQKFKSIRHLCLECRRINLFIGPPDSGKSNLLESLGMFGLPYDPEKLRAFARCRTMADLFHDLDVESPVRVRAGGYAWTLEREPSADPAFRVRSEPFFDGRYGPHANLLEASVNEAGLQDLPFRFYRFAAPDRFPAEGPRFLRPPYGDNTLSLLLRREDLRRTADAVFAAHGLRLALKPEDGRIELRRGREGAAASWPYASGPSTLLRLAFYLLAVDSNDGAFLIFEEPEAHLYPHHVRLLGGADRPRRAEPVLDLHPQRPLPAGGPGEGAPGGRGGVPDRAAKRRDLGPPAGGGGDPGDPGRWVRVLFRPGAPHVHVRELVAPKDAERRMR